MKIPVICGPTASGKTPLALKIAFKTGNASLISIDSRQAYQGLPILTGQDIPPGFIRHQTNACRYQNLPAVYFSKGSINLWGIDQVPLTISLNISDFTNFVWQVIKKETRAKRKIILVGGTGLYLKAVTQPISDIHLGFNQNLRNALSKLSTKELQKKLQNLNLKKFNSLNQSDKHNPRRLIRAIEISKTSPSSKKPAYLKLQKNTTFRWIGLNPNLKKLEKKIHARVLKRLKNKAVIKEADFLQSVQKDSKTPPYSILGLTYILKYVNKEITQPELISAWTKAELKYAKRQLTWFKKQPKIIWYDKL